MLIVDPMLATGGSAAEAIGEMKKRGCKHIKLMEMCIRDRQLPAVDVLLDDDLRAEAQALGQRSGDLAARVRDRHADGRDRKSTRLNSSH